MVKLNELSDTARKALIHEVSWIMVHRYHIDNADIDEFLEYGINRGRSTEERMMRIEDYSDEDLTEELKDRGFAVYKGEDMEQAINKIGGLEKQLISKLNALREKKGDKHGK